MPSNIFFLILAILIFAMVFAQVRNQKMKEKYAALWLLVSATIIILAIFPHLLGALAQLAGVVMPVNLLFMLAIIMLIGVCLHLTLDLSRLGEDTRRLAEEVAILRSQLEKPDHRSGPAAILKDQPSQAANHKRK
ncbi:DUF2304 domain-containing protein [Rothia sp. CCM 9417]|uniref:DUF2304 domain-containing protein n=1 Tax=unclassified Rothia (in: high G+C Gram-positive bacteria) TaxID=2689056 RepID=UPI003ADCAC93